MQTDLNYYSCQDIVTSPLQEHFDGTLTVTWRNLNTTNLPDNTVGCGSCTCRGCFGPSCGCTAAVCCEDKYI